MTLQDHAKRPDGVCIGCGQGIDYNPASGAWTGVATLMDCDGRRLDECSRSGHHTPFSGPIGDGRTYGPHDRNRTPSERGTFFADVKARFGRAHIIGTGGNCDGIAVTLSNGLYVLITADDDPSAPIDRHESVTFGAYHGPEAIGDESRCAAEGYADGSADVIAALVGYLSDLPPTGPFQRFVVTNTSDADRVRRFLPANYTAWRSGDCVNVEGRDVAGWTLEGYVIPRLASGLIFGRHESVRDDRQPTPWPQ